MALQIVIGPTAPVPAAKPLGVPAPAFRFASRDGNRFIQASETNFVHGIIGSYPTWQEFKTSILACWEKFLPMVQANQVVKVGLRYINRIVKDQSHPSLKDWLAPTRDLPAALIESQGHFLGRLESTRDSNNLKLITLSAHNPTPDAPHGAIIFDIDRIRTGPNEVSPNMLAEVIEDLHEDIWQVFSSAKTAVLEKKLSERKS